MKAITLKHPWAFAVARLGKDVENRTWKPPRSFIGQRIAIHGGREPAGSAGLNEAFMDMRVIASSIATRSYLNSLPEPQLRWLQDNDYGNSKLKDWITPGIVATATLECVVTKSDSPWFFGPYGWVLTDVRLLDEPLACRGAQGLWNVPEPIDRLIEAGSLA